MFRRLQSCRFRSFHFAIHRVVSHMLVVIAVPEPIGSRLPPCSIRSAYTESIDYMQYPLAYCTDDLVVPQVEGAAVPTQRCRTRRCLVQGYECWKTAFAPLRSACARQSKLSPPQSERAAVCGRPPPRPRSRLGCMSARPYRPRPRQKYRVTASGLPPPCFLLWQGSRLCRLPRSPQEPTEAQLITLRSMMRPRHRRHPTFRQAMSLGRATSARCTTRSFMRCAGPAVTHSKRGLSVGGSITSHSVFRGCGLERIYKIDWHSIELVPMNKDALLLPTPCESRR